MSAISLKSISGITSITTPAGVDNQLTLHTNNTTERVKIDVSGNVHINNHLAITGVTTASQGLRVPNGSATTNYISVGNNGALRFWGTGHQYADIRAGNLHFRNAALENVLEIQQDKEVYFYGSAFLQNARFDQTVTIADTITHHGDTDTKIRFPAADTITAETAGNERLRITSDGKVGINDDPERKFHVNSGADNECARFESTDTEVTLEFKDLTGIASLKCRNDFRFNNSTGEKVRIASDGKLGINNASPDSALSIAGTGSDAATRVSIKDGVGISNVVGRYGNLVFQADVDNAINGSVMTFEIDGGEAFRVTSDRQIGIGTITPGGDLHIYDGDSSARIYITSGNSDDSSIYFGRVNDTATAAIRYDHSDDTLRFYGYNNSERLRITSAGTLKFTGQNTSLETAGITHHTNNNLYIRGGTSGLVLGNHDSTNTIHISNSDFIKFETTDGTEKFKINSIGQLTSTASNNGQIIHYFKNTDTTSSSSAMTVEQHFNFDRTGGGLNLSAARIIAGKEREWVGAASNQDGYFAIHTTQNETSAEKLRITSAGNIGIGTITPRAKFDVRPGGHSGNGAILFTHNLGEVGSSNNAIQSINGVGSALQPLGYRATEHIFATQSAERLRIPSGGGILIGSGNQTKTQDGVMIERNSVDGAVHITAGRSGGNYSGMNFYVAGASGVTLRHQVDYQSNFKWFAADGTTERLRIHSHGQLELKVPDANDALKITPSGTNAHAKINFSTPGTGAAVIKVQGAERLSIGADGRITNTGIATSFVTTSFAGNYAKLDLRGTNIANTNHYILSYGEGHANDHQFHMVNTLGSLVFRTGTGSNTERLIIDSSGRLMVGTTIVGRPGADELTVGDGSGDRGITIRSGTSNEGNIYFSDSNSAGNGELRGVIRFDHSNDSLQFSTARGNNFATEKLRIKTGGNLIQTLTSTSGTSPFQDSHWYDRDGGNYNLSTTDHDSFTAVRTSSGGTYDNLIYKRVKMSKNCDIEFDLSGNTPSGTYRHVGFTLNADGTNANYDRLVFRYRPGSTSSNQIRIDKANGGGYGFQKNGSYIPNFFDGTERHIIIQLRERLVNVLVDGVVIISEKNNADFYNSSGWFGFGIYEGGENAQVTIRNLEIRNKFQRPRWLVRATGVNVDVSQNNPFPYNQVILASSDMNNSSHYNTGSYRFTAPISGLYYVFLRVYRNSSSGSEVAFFVNGSVRNRFRPQPNGGDFIFAGSCLIQLMKDEYIDVRPFNGSFDNFYGNSSQEFSTWGGHLLD